MDVRIAALQAFRTSSGVEVAPGECLIVTFDQARDLTDKGVACYYSEFNADLLVRTEAQTRVVTQPSVGANVGGPRRGRVTR